MSDVIRLEAAYNRLLSKCQYLEAEVAALKRNNNVQGGIHSELLKQIDTMQERIAALEDRIIDLRGRKQDFAKRIAELEAAQRWIKPSEQQPPLNAPVWLYDGRTMWRDIWTPAWETHPEIKAWMLRQERPTPPEAMKDE